MVSHSPAQLIFDRQLPLLHQFVQHFSVMLHRHPLPVPWILILKRVVSVRVSGNNRLKLRFRESLLVLFLQHLEQALFAHAAHVIAGVALAVIQDAAVFGPTPLALMLAANSFNASSAIRLRVW